MNKRDLKRSLSSDTGVNPKIYTTKTHESSFVLLAQSKHGARQSACRSLCLPLRVRQLDQQSGNFSQILLRGILQWSLLNRLRLAMEARTPISHMLIAANICISARTKQHFETDGQSSLQRQLTGNLRFNVSITAFCSRHAVKHT